MHQTLGEGREPVVREPGRDYLRLYERLCSPANIGAPNSSCLRATEADATTFAVAMVSLFPDMYGSERNGRNDEPTIALSMAQGGERA